MHISYLHIVCERESEREREREREGLHVLGIYLGEGFRVAEFRVYPVLQLQPFSVGFLVSFTITPASQRIPGEYPVEFVRLSCPQHRSTCASLRA